MAQQPSPIYQRPGEEQLFYQPTPGSDFAKIQSPEHLQDLAKQGLVEVNKPRPTLPANAKFAAPAAQTAAPAAQAQPQIGSQLAFTSAFNTLMERGRKMESLRKNRNTLYKALFDADGPLPEELLDLSPAQQAAIRQGNRDLLELEVMAIGDVIKGREDTLATSMSYLFNAAKYDQEQILEAQRTLDEKKQNAIDLIIESGAGDKLGQDRLAEILETGEIDAESLSELAKAVREAEEIKGDEKLLSVSEAKALGVEYGTTVGEAKKMGIIPKSTAVGGGTDGEGIEFTRDEENTIAATGFADASDETKNVIINVLTSKERGELRAALEAYKSGAPFPISAIRTETGAQAIDLDQFFKDWLEKKIQEEEESGTLSGENLQNFINEAFGGL